MDNLSICRKKNDKWTSRRLGTNASVRSLTKTDSRFIAEPINIFGNVCFGPSVPHKNLATRTTEDTKNKDQRRETTMDDVRIAIISVQRIGTGGLSQNLGVRPVATPSPHLTFVGKLTQFCQSTLPRRPSRLF